MKLMFFFISFIFIGSSVHAQQQTVTSRSGLFQMRYQMTSPQMGRCSRMEFDLVDSSQRSVIVTQRPVQICDGVVMLSDAGVTDGGNCHWEQRDNLRVYPWMPAHGHGSRDASVRQTIPGHFVATMVCFVMGGPWDVHVAFRTMTGGRELEDEAVFSVDVR